MLVKTSGGKKWRALQASWVKYFNFLIFVGEPVFCSLLSTVCNWVIRCTCQFSTLFALTVFMKLRLFPQFILYYCAVRAHGLFFSGCCCCFFVTTASFKPGFVPSPSRSVSPPVSDRLGSEALVAKGVTQGLLFTASSVCRFFSPPPTLTLAFLTEFLSCCSAQAASAAQSTRSPSFPGLCVSFAESRVQFSFSLISVLWKMFPSALRRV